MSSRTAELEVLAGSGHPARIPVVSERTLIGRAEDSTVVLNDTMLSRRHAAIECEGEDYFLLDLGSTNGTFVNGRRITEKHRLRHGDLIAVGETYLLFSNPPPSDGTATPSPDGAQSFTLRDLRAARTNQSLEIAGQARQTRLMHLISKATSSLLGTRPLPELFERVLDVIFEALPAERAAIVLLGPKGELELRASRSRVGQPVDGISDVISRRVVNERVGLVIPSVLDDPNLRDRPSVLVPGIRSAICAPLWLSHRHDGTEEVIGLAYADTSSTMRAFGEAELEILTAFGNVAASKIEAALLRSRSVDHDRLAGEIAAAAEIQRSILPTEAPLIPGCDLVGESRSCDEVGGDYHDYDWDGQRLLVALADVSGKGLGAAMLMTALRSAVRAHWRVSSMAGAGGRINRTFFENVPVDRYATAFVARFDPFGGQLEFLNAGHPPALIIRANNTIDRLDPTGPGLGLFQGATFESGVTRLDPGDTLVIYSDGVSESWDSDAEAEAFIAATVRAGRRQSSDTVRERILATVDQRRGVLRSDDRTLVILRRQTRIVQQTPAQGRPFARVWRSGEV